MNTGAKDYFAVPGWQSNNPTHAHGRLSYVEATRRGNMAHVQAGGVRQEELHWLQRCLLAEVKNCDDLNDLSYLMERAGFLNIKVKYTGGLRVLLECTTTEEAQKALNEGLPTLMNWFNWVCPWSMEKELERPRRLIWLNISGVPLHAWNGDNFSAIASAFGVVLEVEDWTEGKEQTNIGRVLILTNSIHTIF